MNARISIKNIVFGIIFVFFLIGVIVTAIPMLNNKKICYGAGEGAEGLQVAGTTLSCCPGLSAINNSSCGDPDCSIEAMTEGFVCAKCGDGNCGKGENQTNCLKDCGKPAASGESDSGKVCYGEGEGDKGLTTGEMACCPGLSPIDNSSYGIWTEGFICAKCGDGNCGKGENKINCPKDCAGIITQSGTKSMGEDFKLSAENFNFDFKYGMCDGTTGCNELDTSTGIYVKNMCGDPDVKTEIKLSKEEMASVYNKINELRLLNDFSQETDEFFTPAQDFFLTLKNGAAEKLISWKEYTPVAAYRSFGAFLVQLIESRPEFKKLPVPVCGYL